MPIIWYVKYPADRQPVKNPVISVFPGLAQQVTNMTPENRHRLSVGSDRVNLSIDATITGYSKLLLVPGPREVQSPRVKFAVEFPYTRKGLKLRRS